MQGAWFIGRTLYDRLAMWNFTDVFGHSIYLWAIPIKYEMEGRGYYYPKIPIFDHSDLFIDDLSLDESKEDDNIEEYAKMVLDEYKGMKFEINGKSYQS